MHSTKEIIKAKKYPTFIKSNKVFKEFDEIKKIFPSIGLPNCKEEIEIDFRDTARKSAFALAQFIYSTIRMKYNYISNKKKKIINLNKLFANFCSGCDDYIKFVKDNNGKFTLNIPNDVLDENKKTIFRSGESLFRVYNKLNAMLIAAKTYPMRKLENATIFKKFSSNNIPSKKYNIVFSSEGADGVWDIATMSMRGIKSCQSWTGNSEYKHKIIGSMVDPFTAIIYLEGGKENDKGSGMLRRCVVRFLSNNGKPSIGLESMYPSHDENIVKAFIKFIKEKIKEKFPVELIRASKNICIPRSKILNTLENKNLPYSDNGAIYGNNICNIILTNVRKLTDKCFTSIEFSKFPKYITETFKYVIEGMLLNKYHTCSDDYKSFINTNINILLETDTIKKYTKSYGNSYCKEIYAWIKNKPDEEKAKLDIAVKKYFKNELIKINKKKIKTNTLLDKYVKAFN